MKHVLLLGSAGTLGQALVTTCAKRYTVTAWDKFDLDILDFEKTKNQITELNPNVIINAVAMNAVDAIETDDALYELAKKVNGYAVGNLASIAHELAIPLVHFSTDYVFDGEAVEGYREDAIPRPISRYGETKLLGEDQAQSNTQACYIVRISRLFGKKGVSESSKRSFVDTMLELSKTKDHLDIVNDQVSSPSYAPDVAELVCNLLEHNKPYGIYHGANSGACTWYEWAKEIFALQHIAIATSPVSAEHFSRPARAPMNSILLNTKMPSQPTWQDALRRYLLEI